MDREGAAAGMSGEWPWPGDTPTERARRIANSLLTLLPADEQPVWTARAHGYGETWLGSSLVRWTADDIVSTKEAADMVHVLPPTIRRWHSDGELANTGEAGRYRVGDVLDCAGERRQRRLKRRG